MRTGELETQDKSAVQRSGPPSWQGIRKVSKSSYAQNEASGPGSEDASDPAGRLVRKGRPSADRARIEVQASVQGCTFTRRKRSTYLLTVPKLTGPV